MSVPKVIFKNNFVYQWHIGEFDMIDYMERPQAFQKSESLLNMDSEDYDFIQYMENDEKSDGCFSATTDKMTPKEIFAFRQNEKNSQREGCPKYIQIISFDNNFLRENGLIAGSSPNLSKIKFITRIAMNKLVESEPKFDTDNVYWCGAIHLNTDNIHVHVSMLEKNRREDRIKKYKDGDMISVDAFDKLKSAVISEIIKNDNRTQQLTKLEREILLPKFQEQFTNTTAQMINLINILPPEGAWQYNRPKMKPYRSMIDSCVNNIFNSSEELTEKFKEYNAKLDEMCEYYKDVYGEGQRAKYLSYKTNRLKDFYQRAGNSLLKELAVLKNNCDDFTPKPIPQLDDILPDTTRENSTGKTFNKAKNSDRFYQKRKYRWLKSKNSYKQKCAINSLNRLYREYEYKTQRLIEQFEYEQAQQEQTLAENYDRTY